MNYLLVFCAMFLADVCWTRYFIEVAAKRAFIASMWSGAIVACGAYAVVNYVHDPLAVAAAVAGSVLGTYVTMKKSK